MGLKIGGMARKPRKDDLWSISQGGGNESFTGEREAERINRR